MTFINSLEKIKMAPLNNEFPDEVDTPMDQPARVRFQKYLTYFFFQFSHTLYL